MARGWHDTICSRFRSPLDDGAEMIGRRAVLLLDRVHVERHRDRRRRVAEPGLHRLQVLSGMEQRGGAGVPPGVARRRAHTFARRITCRIRSVRLSDSSAAPARPGKQKQRLALVALAPLHRGRL